MNRCESRSVSDPLPTCEILIPFRIKALLAAQAASSLLHVRYPLLTFHLPIHYRRWLDGTLHKPFSISHERLGHSMICSDVDVDLEAHNL